MKKIFAILLIIALAAGLTACAAGESAAEDAAPTMTPEEARLASETNASAIAQSEDEAPASDTDAETDTEAYEQAMQYIGQPVEELYAAIGEPESANYAASCDEENAEDGMLFYGGFYVWTVKTETEEIIHDIYEG